MEYNYFIYRITCKCGLIYIGSTKNYGKRMGSHKNRCYNKNQRIYNIKVYNHIRECCSFHDCNIMKIFKYRGDKFTKAKVENYFIKKFNSVECGLNDRYAYTDKKEYDRDYREDNKEKVKEYKKRWYEDNKEKRKEYEKQWYQENKEKMKEKFNCICGSIYRKSDKARHERSKKHKQYINTN